MNLRPRTSLVSPLFSRGALLSLVFLGPILLSIVASAQEAFPESSENEAASSWTALVESIEWTTAKSTGIMGREAEILVPPGYVFTGREGTRTLMQAFGNLLTEEELGFIAPVEQEGEVGFPWFAVFEFGESGHVKDDEKGDLDPAEMMKSLRKGQEAANREREELGYDSLSITGWAMEPRYNEITNNMEWALSLRAGNGAENVNLNTRLLGREGVMRVTLVCDPEILESIVPEYQELLEEFSFQEGQRYADYRKGDKLAKYGLTGLVVGGGVAVLAKTGLLKKFLKPILLGLAALGVFMKKLFGRGGGKDTEVGTE